MHNFLSLFQFDKPMRTVWSHNPISFSGEPHRPGPLLSPPKYPNNPAHPSRAPPSTQTVARGRTRFNPSPPKTTKVLYTTVARGSAPASRVHRPAKYYSVPFGRSFFVFFRVYLFFLSFSGFIFFLSFFFNNHQHRQ